MVSTASRSASFEFNTAMAKLLLTVPD